MLEFELKKDDHVDLCDLLKILKLCDNGADAKHVISEGKVKVDGAVELRKRAKIRRAQVVEYAEQKIKIL